MASNEPAAAMSSEVASEIELLRQQNKELQSQLEQLKLQVSQNGKRVNGDALSSPKRESTPLHHRRSTVEESFHDEERTSPQKNHSTHKAKSSPTAHEVIDENNALNPPVALKQLPSSSSNLDGISTPKKSNRKNPTKDNNGDYKQVFQIDEENGLQQAQSAESEDPASESDELIHDDSSHNKHQNRRRMRARVHHVETFWHDIKERAGWLIGLLFLQSCSSFIIQYNESFLQGHMVIVQFLTMLVGAGGNAGNQASVRVIRGLAVGTLNDRTIRPFLKQEVKMGFGLSALLGLTGCIRAALFRTPLGETIAVTTSLCAIVLISVVIGNMLPLGMKKVGIDPAHSSTTIQVVMDIMGVLITVCVSSFVLSFKVFQHDDSTDGSDETVT
jgi:hypothetical protein